MATSKLTIDKKQFKKVKREIIDRMVAVDNFIDYAIEYNLITMKDEREIEYRREDDKIRKVLQIIKKKLKEKSCHLLKALMESGNDILARKLVPNVDICKLRKELQVDPDPLKEFSNRYPMEPEIFKQFRVRFVEDLYVPLFIDYSYQMELITQHNRKEILSTQDTFDQARRLFRIIYKKLPEKSDLFFYCMNHSDNDGLVEMFFKKLQYGPIDFSHFHPTDGRMEILGKIPFEDPKLLSIADIDPCDIVREFIRNYNGQPGGYIEFTLRLNDDILSLLLAPNTVGVALKRGREINNMNSLRTIFEMFSSGAELISTEEVSSFEEVDHLRRESLRELVPTTFNFCELKRDTEPKKNVMFDGRNLATRLFKMSYRVNNEKIMHLWMHREVYERIDKNRYALVEDRRRNDDQTWPVWGNRYYIEYYLTCMVCSDKSVDFIKFLDLSFNRDCFD